MPLFILQKKRPRQTRAPPESDEDEEEIFSPGATAVQKVKSQESTCRRHAVGLLQANELHPGFLTSYISELDWSTTDNPEHFLN
jgi:hypothetical protein